MDRLRPPLSTLALLAALAAGCTHTGKPARPPAAPPVTAAKPGPSGVVPANFQVPQDGPPPAARPPAVRAKGPPVAQIEGAWRNHLDHLPDPAKGGAMSPGLAGQVFLFDRALRFAPANGSLTVEMFDESKPGFRNASAPRVGQWTFDRETLKGLKAVDETFGDSYTLFLPWPDYRPDISRVRLAVRYDPDGGAPLFASAATITLDASGGQVWTGETTTAAPAGLPPAAPAPLPQGVMPLAPPAPRGAAGNPAGGGPMPPGGLPPFVIIPGASAGR